MNKTHVVETHAQVHAMARTTENGTCLDVVVSVTCKHLPCQKGEIGAEACSASHKPEGCLERSWLNELSRRNTSPAARSPHHFSEHFLYI